VGGKVKYLLILAANQKENRKEETISSLQKERICKSRIRVIQIKQKTYLYFLFE
jgi:hypothetical protein